MQKLWQVHTKASSGASPVTSQLRWARLDVTGLAPLPCGVVVVGTVVSNPLVQGVTHTHTHVIEFWFGKGLMLGWSSSVSSFLSVRCHTSLRVDVDGVTVLQATVRCMRCMRCRLHGGFWDRADGLSLGTIPGLPRTPSSGHQSWPGVLMADSAPMATLWMGGLEEKMGGRRSG